MTLKHSNRSSPWNRAPQLRCGQHRRIQTEQRAAGHRHSRDLYGRHSSLEKEEKEDIGHGYSEKNRVEPIQDTAVPWKQRSGIL